MPLHQFDYLFVIGTLFAYLNAWNIGMPGLLCLSPFRASTEVHSLSVESNTRLPYRS